MKFIILSSLIDMLKIIIISGKVILGSEGELFCIRAAEGSTWESYFDTL